MTNQFYQYKNDKSIEAFDFTYTPIEQTISEMAELFKQAKENDLSFSRMELN